MQGPSASDGPRPASMRMAHSTSKPFPKSSGRFSSAMFIPVISVGTTMRPISPGLRANRQAHGGDRRHGPAREGPALLQGLVICGRCGNRMTVGYHEVKGGKRLYPEYRCQKEYVEEGDDKCCQRLRGAGLDAAIAELLLARLTPLSIETSLQI